MGKKKSPKGSRRSGFITGIYARSSQMELIDTFRDSLQAALGVRVSRSGLIMMALEEYIRGREGKLRSIDRMLKGGEPCQ